MDFSKIDFTHDCYVDLHVGDYGSLSGVFFIGRPDLAILEKPSCSASVAKSLYISVHS